MTPYHIYPNVQTYEAMQQITSRTANVRLSLNWLELHLAVDTMDGNMIFAKCADQSVLLSERPCEGITRSLGPLKPWVVQVLHPKKYLSETTAIEMLKYENFEAYEICSSTAHEDLYLQDLRCGVLFCNPHQQRFDLRQFAPLAGKNLKFISDVVSRRSTPRTEGIGDLELDALLRRIGGGTAAPSKKLPSTNHRGQVRTRSPA